MSGAEPRASRISVSDARGRSSPDDGPHKEEEVSGAAGTSALSQLFRAQYSQLLRFCRMRIRSEADAEDIVQSAFLAARRFYPQKGIEELRPLLFTLVRNNAINHLKSWSARQQRASDIYEDGGQLACDQSPTPERKVIDVQRLEIAQAVIADLPERRREALRLHRLEGLTYEEIAKRLSVSPTTAKNDVAQAVAEVAKGLARADGGSAGAAE
ncbi:MAG TPA: sigma-70 family RNA polymerase sigma factor [Hyphomonas sp.]|nr:hypothetical protein [Hyphomonas sp.]HRJ02189.1 sigma-70 family RNA polymerase sigma factor [Hyphomonas sp.]HRK69281.1 sigma-70 family RNA polymerase sigma factor [Hyphomonas sp.]